MTAARRIQQVKTKHLDGLTLNLPEGDLADPVQPVGTFTAKKAEYNVYLGSVPSADTTLSSKRRRDELPEGDGEAASGPGAAGELQTLVPLLPRKSQGNKLFQGTDGISFRPFPVQIVAQIGWLTYSRRHGVQHQLRARSPEP